jgi:signal transduction histidine kinase
LHLQVAELQASRQRLVVASVADRRRIERELHEGVQQDLVALAVNLQLASDAAEADPATAKALLDELGRHVQQALDDTARLARWIYPPLLEGGGLAAALRAAAASGGSDASVELAAAGSYPPGVAWTAYACCVEALERAGAGARITVRDEGDALAFEVAGGKAAEHAADAVAGLEPLRDRVEALGGSLALSSEPGERTWIAGRLPLPR